MTTITPVRADHDPIEARVERPARVGAVTDRIAARRLIDLPLRGAGAAFTDTQPRSHSQAVTPTELVDLITSIASVGVLEPILVEEIPRPAGGVDRRLVAGERRLRACRWGLSADPDNPRFASIPALVCTGPLTDTERHVWQIIENLARTDLRPGELAAGLLLARSAILAAALTEAGHPPDPDVVADPDPVRRWKAVDAHRARYAPALAAPWPLVLRRLGVQISPRKARALVAAFRELPREMSEQMDAHRVALCTRTTMVRIASEWSESAARLWDAVRDLGRADLLPAAAAATLANPELPAAQALTHAIDTRERANAARAEKLTADVNPSQQRSEPDDPSDQEPDSDHHHQDATIPAEVDGDLVRRILTDLRALTTALRTGRRPARYDAGSLRLLLTDARDLLATDITGEVEMS